MHLWRMVISALILGLGSYGVYRIVQVTPPAATLALTITPAPATPAPSITPVPASPSATLKPDVVPPQGDVITVPIDELCLKNYVSQKSSVSVTVQKKVFTKYKVDYPSDGKYQLDHFIPVELGGSNSMDNLWPQPASPKPGFQEKNQVEQYLYKQVCSGAISLKSAQQQIRDWQTVYNKIR